MARAAGVRKSLIRYYEAVGLIPPAPRVSGQRRYDASVLRRLAVIDVAQRAGLSLEEIGDLLEIGSDPFSPRLRALAERRPPEIERLIERAGRVRAWLETATACECATVEECALFDDPLLPAGPARVTSSSSRGDIGPDLSAPPALHLHKVQPRNEEER